ncbi:methylamine utilization protein MauJ [uncultured Aquitalea sp.]|uniref:methylamine utilization protein MauJ n=1 Tax=uncultured Aquitalea sp. TaxID=540272 RepID=UPI0025F8D226|nr:methylamine utilization protein MauJ [uncultured Aquitalea sp.]
MGTAKFKTPYIPHYFKDKAQEFIGNRLGWFTAGVSSSIAWPQEDVLVVYDGTEFLLRGCAVGGKQEPPCISTPCPSDNFDDAFARILRFVSVLGWFKGGYVDVSGYTWSTHPIRYGHLQNSFTTMTQGGPHCFDCTYMPIIEDDRVRKALAFCREGRRLRYAHEAYSFLSFFKVLESQFKKKEAKDRVAWIERNLDKLDGHAAKRVAELRSQGVNVSKHLFDSGRCAVAHASLDGDIVDPDIPADRRQIGADLDIIEGLANRYLAEEVCVPTEMTVYRTRDRLEPWYPLMDADGLVKLKAGEEITDAAELGQLAGAKVTVRLWPREPDENLKDMTIIPFESGPSLVKFYAVNQRETILLTFGLDANETRMHALLDEGGITEQTNELTEDEVATYTRYLHSVVGNAQVELLIDGVEPVRCEIIIPTNIFPRNPEEAVLESVEAFRHKRGHQKSQA